MRTNLALVDSFVRMSFLEPPNNQNLPDLGFLGLTPGEEQLQVHNYAVLTLIATLLYQALQNYGKRNEVNTMLPELDAIRQPQLEHPAPGFPPFPAAPSPYLRRPWPSPF